MQKSSFELTHKIVRAGAGAGKTTRLISEVLSFAKGFREMNGRYPKMVLSTFTRKATQELKERLILEACKTEDEQLLEYLSSNAFLQISTLHGVMSLFLRRYGHLAGLDNGYVVVTEQEATRMAKKILRDLVIQEQDVALLASELGIQRLSVLLRQWLQMNLEHPRLHPYQIEDFQTIWAQCWSEQVLPVKNLIQEIRQNTTDVKYLEYTASLEALVKAAEKNPEGLQQTLADLPSKPRLKKKDPQIPESLDHQIKDIVDNFKKEIRRPEMETELWPSYVEFFAQIEKAGEKFKSQFLSAKQETGRFEMGDLEVFTIDILRRHPELAKAFSTDFDYWLIDEYQDTSPLQVELLNLLVGDRPTFIVGDPQQSIYLFRGARSEVFKEREKWVQRQNGKLELKDKNWRSRPELLEFFNHVFTAMNSDFISMQPRDAVNTPDEVVCTLAQVNSQDFAEDEDQELHAISSHIAYLLNEKGASPEEICVLSRTNAALMDVAHYLKSRGFPTHVNSSRGFFWRREILDAMALLKFLVNPHDNANLILLLRSPWCRISDPILARAIFSEKNSYWVKIKSDETVQSHPVVIELLHLIDKKSEVGITAAFEEALVQFGFFDFSHHHDVTGRRESNLWKLLIRLKEEERRPGFSFLQFINQSQVEFDSEDGSDEADAVAALEPNHIQLMTIHASKGLQFKHVLITDINKPLRPPKTPVISLDQVIQCWSASRPVGENGEYRGTIADLFLRKQRQKLDAEESLRVFYVAATRAKDSLFLSWQGEVKPNTWAARLPFSLEPGVHRQDHFSYHVLQSPFSPKEYTSQLSKVSEVRPLYEAKETSDPFLKVSVSSLLQDQKIDFKKSGATLTLPDRIRASVDGVLIHRFMETLKYNFAFDFNKVAESWFGNRAEEILRAIDFVRNLSEPPLESIIKNGHVEWGFQRLTDNGIIEGQIDLWGEASGQTWVIDYKSGSPAHEELAFKQLAHYAEALKGYGASTPMQLCVVYPMVKKVSISNC